MVGSSATAPSYAPGRGSRPAPRRISGVSGHSKWAGIKHKKAIVDARRGAHFTKLARAITVAAREGGGDADANAALANAVQKARDASMPKDNIERAIAKGAGGGADADAIETVVYEGYGPGGVALLIEAYTDNRNRTGADVRHLLTKNGGNLGEPGSVSYLFDKRGLVLVDASRYGEEDLLVAVEAGAEDIVADDALLEVWTAPGDLSAVRAAIEASGIAIESAEVIQRPQVRVEVDEQSASRLFRLIEALEDNDDVGAVHANFEVSDEILERIA
jgi:YebC/PmpR family DNA-binding regulatory protein